MSYITRADIEAIYGAEQLLRLLPADGSPDALVAQAAALASGEADLYLSKRYPVPLALVPDGLKAMLVDLACYRLAVTHDRLTEELTERAKVARKTLEMIAAGKAGLGIAEPATGGEPAPGGAGISSDDGAYFTSRERNFGRERGLP